MSSPRVPALPAASDSRSDLRPDLHSGLVPDVPAPASAPETGPSIWLASRSPRRLDLLAQIGVRAELLLDPDESRAEALEARLTGELPAPYVCRIARLKALAGCERLAVIAREASLDSAPPVPMRAVLAADTTVAIGSTIFAKPLDADDAARMIGALQGRTHRVLTAVALALPGGMGDSDKVRVFERLQVSKVRFSRLKAGEIARYVASGEPFGKAGGYAIQGLAAAFVRRIDGSHSGIMGLPIFETVQLLRKTGLVIPPAPGAWPQWHLS